MPTQQAHTEPVTRFQALLRAWIDADPARNPRDLARAAGLAPSVIYKLLAKPLSQVPATETVEGLASAGVAPVSQLRFVVAVDLGLIPAERRDVDAVARKALQPPHHEDG